MHWIGRAHILPTWQSNFTSYEERGGVAHAYARHGVCCMHVSFCMHFCKLQAYAEAQVYLMQECHASVACNLHV